MENMENGILGIFEPRCKIRFLSDPRPEEEYIAVPASDMIELISCQLKLAALESGGVDNWSAYGWAMSDYMEELPNCYDAEKLSMWAAMEKSDDETIEEFIEDMDIEDFARFEVYIM
jgi:hypothetical protein